jgi:putative hydrolase of the HAD superfamily
MVSSHSASLIRGIVFDFGNVLCSFDIETLVHNLATLSSAPARQIREGLKRSSEVARKYETGLISSAEFHVELCRRTGIAAPLEEFRKAYCDIFVPIPASFDLVRQLKRSYRLGLLSNTSEWHFESAIRSVEIFPLFNAVTLSFQVKVLKPAEPIYRDMLTRLGLSAGECVYIDDLAENVDAARRLGFCSILYTSHEELLGILHTCGVSV